MCVGGGGEKQLFVSANLGLDFSFLHFFLKCLKALGASKLFPTELILQIFTIFTPPPLPPQVFFDFPNKQRGWKEQKLTV